jgi:membrane-associated phospholipid phosphatase
MTRQLLTTILIILQLGSLQAGEPDSVFVKQREPLPGCAIPVMTVATGGAFFFDGPFRNHHVSHPTAFKKDFSEISDYFGNKKFVVPAVVAAYGAGRFVFRNPKLQITAFRSFQSILATALVTETIKISTGRARPYLNKGPHNFKPFSFSDNHYKSFPSGHASLAFAAFTPFAESYSRWLYAIPASVAIGRVWQDKHWTSDVIAGSCLGFISGFLFMHNENVQIIPNGLVVTF